MYGISTPSFQGLILGATDILCFSTAQHEKTAPRKHAFELKTQAYTTCSHTDS